MPPHTRPKIVLFPSSIGAGPSNNKNCEVLVFGPWFAIVNTPAPVCRSSAAQRNHKDMIAPQTHSPERLKKGTEVTLRERLYPQTRFCGYLSIQLDN